MKKTLITILFLLPVSFVMSAERVALLIGCSNYTDLHELTTPVNDATALKTTLESPALGFECLPVVKNATLEKFYEALDSFQARAKDARVALIFYSGHGIEHDGVNYLIPVNAELNTATQLKTQALNVSAVMEALAKTNATAKLAILDCCRDNPFKVTKSWTATKSVRDEVLKELGDADIPQSTLVCFATSAGRKAAAVLNDSSTNSPFTQFLVKEIQTPGLSLRDVFEHVHDTLESATEGRQVPAVKTDNALSRVFRQTVLVPGTAPTSNVSMASRSVAPLATLPGSASLAPTPAAGRTPLLASKAAPFVNSLGMKFVPVVNYQGGKTVLFSIWETRRQDYAAYAAKTSGVDTEWKAQEYKGVAVGQKDTEPVVSVSWEDSTAFCAWLTKTERAAGRIGISDEYRLPTDVEWSYAVGIGDKEDASATPEAKDAKIADVYPWGKGFPPPAGSGNYSDATAKAKVGFTSIEGYNDGYATTAPVGSFEANTYGLYDLGGNVWEWCQDWYNADQKSRVLRGGSWVGYGREGLLSSSRYYGSPSDRGNDGGFRVVLVAGGSPKSD